MWKQCAECETKFWVKPSHFDRRLTCSKKCRNRRDSRLYAGEGNPAYGKVYQTKESNPEWAGNIKKATEGKINLGDNNGMKQAAVRTRMSASRRKRLADDPELRRKIAENTHQAWVDGKFEGVAVGQCKWYPYTKKDGTVINLQGTWELAFAKWMDENDIQFITHRSWIPYKDKQGNDRLYYPDFYVETWGEWVDVKNDYHWGLQKDKFDCIRRSNPKMKLRVILKDELQKLGVIL